MFGFTLKCCLQIYFRWFKRPVKYKLLNFEISSFNLFLIGVKINSKFDDTLALESLKWRLSQSTTLLWSDCYFFRRFLFVQAIAWSSYGNPLLRQSQYNIVNLHLRTKKDNVQNLKNWWSHQTLYIPLNSKTKQNMEIDNRLSRSESNNSSYAERTCETRGS